MYICAGLTLVLTALLLGYGTLFPGVPEDPSGTCGAPGASGCEPGTLWVFFGMITGMGGLGMLAVGVVFDLAHAVWYRRSTD